MLALSAKTGSTHPTPRSSYADDPRRIRLVEFFQAARSPVAVLAEDFLVAADRNHLDWRLLPGICMIETSGGKNLSGNNLFGWGSGRYRFPSARAGIHSVASRLSSSKLYKNKGVVEILRTYNNQPRYPARVQAVMRRIVGDLPVSSRPEPGHPAYSSNRTPK
jgi:hypothetical protein